MAKDTLTLLCDITSELDGVIWILNEHGDEIILLSMVKSIQSRLDRLIGTK